MQVSGTLGDRAGLGPLKQALHAYALRHRVISSNIANAEVPGYRAREATFDEELVDAIRSGDTDAVNAAKFAVRENPTGGPVNADKEMAGMVKNAMLFETFSQIAAARFRLMRTALTGP